MVGWCGGLGGQPGGIAPGLGADLDSDAREQALWARPCADHLVHHSDRGVPYVSIRYTERLAEAGVEPLVGRVGEACDNTMAEMVNAMF